jgi:hypothetical protein
MAKETGKNSGAAVAAPVSTTYLRYNRDNFTVWATTMEWALESNELWEAVDPGGGEAYTQVHQRDNKLWCCLFEEEGEGEDTWL